MDLRKQRQSLQACEIGDFVLDQDVDKPRNRHDRSSIVISGAVRALEAQILSAAGDLLKERPFPVMIFERGGHKQEGSASSQ